MKRFTALFISLVLSVPAFATDYTITGGYFGARTISGFDSLIMTGGGDSLTGEDNSVLDIRNTSPLVVLSGGLWDVILRDSSHLNFSGGQMSQLNIDDYATAVLSGGLINKIRNYQTAYSPHIEVICKDYLYNATSKILTGTWTNNSTFNTQLIDVAGYTPTYNNIEFTIIPEPTSLLLLAAGGLLLKRR